MDIGTWIALAALLVSVVYHWADRRDMLTKIGEWRIHVDKRIDSLEIDFKNSQYGVLSNKVANLEHLVQELRDWKHEKVDPYVPRAIDDHERRINRLEAR